MSLIADVMTQLEVELRLIIPTLPTGSTGVEDGWRPAHQLEPGEFPHVFLYDEGETRERLIFNQARVTVSLKGLIVRRDSGSLTNVQADYEALSDSLEADPTINGVCEQSDLVLDGFEREEGKPFVACAFTLSATKVLP